MLFGALGKTPLPVFLSTCSQTASQSESAGDFADVGVLPFQAGLRS